MYFRFVTLWRHSEGTWGLQGRVCGILAPILHVQYVRLKWQNAPVLAAYHCARMISIMAISDESLDEFIALYESECGERLTRVEARPIAANLVTLYRMVMSPPPNPAPDSSRTVAVDA